MTESDSNRSKLDEVIKAYLLAKDSGDSPSREQLLSQHPHIVEELKEFFESQERAVETQPTASDESKPNLADTLEHAVDKEPERNAVTERLAKSDFDTEAKTIRRVQSDEPAPTPESSIARKTLGDYELLEQIGQGGMGVVFRARQVRLDRIVALKTIRSGSLASQREIVRFQTEAEAAAELDHPAIVPVFEVGESEGTHFFSMGYVDGISLGEKLHEGPLLPQEAAELVAQLANAVAYAHGKGVIHRDLKPDNVLLDEQGQPRITDFGLAKRIDTDSGQTQSGEVLGTPSYMPPEQATGSRKIGPTSDVYGLGAILYASLTVRPPFQAASQIDTLVQVMENEPVPPRQMNPGIPRDLDTICLKCLQKEQEKRYPSARELAEDLERFVAGEPIHARPVGASERMWMWCKRNPKVALPTAVAVLLGIVLMIGGPTLAFNFYQQKEYAEKQRGLAESNEQRANSNFDLAMENAESAVDTSRLVMDEIFDVYNSRSPKEQLLMKDLLQIALDGAQEVSDKHDKLLAAAQIESKADIGVASANKKLGQVALEIGQFTQAHKYLEKSLKVALSLGDRLERADENLANVYDLLGRVHLKLGLLDDSETSYRKALDQLKQIVAKQPALEDRAVPYMARCLSGLGGIAKERGQPEEARKYSDQALKLRRDWEARFPDDLKGQRRLSAELYLRARKESDYVAAKKLFDEAIATTEGLLAKRPEASLDAVRLARYRMGLADSALQFGKPNEAKSIYADAIVSLNALREELPNHGSTVDSLAHAYYAMGIACQQTGDARAKEHFRQGLTIRQSQFDKDPMKKNKIKLMFALARCEEHEKASALAKQIQQGAPNSGDLVAIAGGLALCSAVAELEQARKQEYIQASLDSLRAAVASGYANTSRLRVDPDLAPIQGLDSFLELLEQIEDRSKKKKSE